MGQIVSEERVREIQNRVKMVHVTAGQFCKDVENCEWRYLTVAKKQGDVKV